MPVRCHPNEPWSTLYSGRFGGKDKGQSDRLLPEDVPKGDDITFRKYVRKSGPFSSMAHVAFRDGKVVTDSVGVETLSGK